MKWYYFTFALQWESMTQHVAHAAMHTEYTVQDNIIDVEIGVTKSETDTDTMVTSKATDTGIPNSSPPRTSFLQNLAISFLHTVTYCEVQQCNNMIHARIWNIYHMSHIWCIYYIYYIYYIHDTKNWLHFFFYNAKLIVSLMVFCRSAIVPRKNSYGESRDDKQVIRQSPTDRIDKSGQILAPCGRQALETSSTKLQCQWQEQAVLKIAWPQQSWCSFGLFFV